jgi:hypothetical protein
LVTLQQPFSPLKIVKDVTSEPSSAVLEEHLGASFSLEVSAIGSPSPKYQWFHLATGARDWTYLRVNEGQIEFKDFGVEDFGRYGISFENGVLTHWDIPSPI